MIQFYFNAAPNPMKVALLLEELGLAYQAVPVDTISSVESRDLMAPGKSSSAGNTVKTSNGKGGSPFMTVAESNAKFEQQMQAANAANTSPAA